MFLQTIEITQYYNLLFWARLVTSHTKTLNRDILSLENEKEMAYSMNYKFRCFLSLFDKKRFLGALLILLPTSGILARNLTLRHFCLKESFFIAKILITSKLKCDFQSH